MTKHNDFINPTNPDTDAEGGLTKVEYFAAMAMQGLLTKYNLSNPEDQKTITKLSVELSNELIIQLNRHK